jgi:hypothetical protein
MAPLASHVFDREFSWQFVFVSLGWDAKSVRFIVLSQPISEVRAMVVLLNDWAFTIQ